jgi:hypothetical protein
MTRMSFVIAAAMMSAVTLTSTLAQAQFSEPAAYQATHPDRDVLNGGQLTPATRAAFGRKGGPGDAFASQGYPSPNAPAVHSRQRRQHQ